MFNYPVIEDGKTLNEGLVERGANIYEKDEVTYIHGKCNYCLLILHTDERFYQTVAELVQIDQERTEISLSFFYCDSRNELMRAVKRRGHNALYALAEYDAKHVIIQTD